MRKLSLVLFHLVCLAMCAEMEDGVMILTDSNFEEEVKKLQFILIDFYAPWW